MNRDHLKTAAAMLGAELVRAREHRQLTQRGLAAKVGIGRVTLANLEAGRGSVAALVVVLKFLEHRFSDQPCATELGGWLARIRKSAGLSQERLSSEAGIAKFALVRVERNHGNVATLVAAMDALGVVMSLSEIEAVPPPMPAPTARLLLGDCRDHMQDLTHKSVLFDAIVTDPPYHLTSISRRFGRKDAAPLTGGEPGSDNPYRIIRPPSFHLA